MNIDLGQIKKDLESDYYDRAGVELCKEVIRILVAELEAART